MIGTYYNWKANKSKELHDNFSGYTSTKSYDGTVNVAGIPVTYKEGYNIHY